jgi:large subunit ribosomal protein L31
LIYGWFCIINCPPEIQPEDIALRVAGKTGVFMKQGIHPDYHKITVVMTDGTKYETRSTWGKEGDVLQLDVDPKTHPAWVGGVNLRKTGQMEKFQNKFGNFAAATSQKKEEKKDDAK